MVSYDQDRKRIVGTYNKQADQWISRVANNSLTDLIKKHVKKYMNILEIGCGGGRATFAIAPYCKRIVAVDMAKLLLKGAIDYAQKNSINNIDFMLGDGEKLPFRNGSFDMIISSMCISMRMCRAEYAFAESYRTLNTSGYLICSTNHRKDKKELEISRIGYDKRFVKRLLKRIGFYDVKVKEKKRKDRLTEEKMDIMLERCELGPEQRKQRLKEMPKKNGHYHLTRKKLLVYARK